MSEQEIDVDLEPDEPDEDEAQEDAATEQEPIIVDPIPGYITLDEGDQKNEARRAFILATIVKSDGVPASSYASLLIELDAVMKGESTTRPKPGFTTVPGGKKGGA